MQGLPDTAQCRDVSSCVSFGAPAHTAGEKDNSKTFKVVGRMTGEARLKLFLGLFAVLCIYPALADLGTDLHAYFSYNTTFNSTYPENYFCADVNTLESTALIPGGFKGYAANFTTTDDSIYYKNTTPPCHTLYEWCNQNDTGGFSVFMWAYINSDDRRSWLLETVGTLSDETVRFYYDTNADPDTLKIILRENDLSGIITAQHGPLSLHSWYHLGFVYNHSNRNLSLYVDSVEEDTAEFTGSNYVAPCMETIIGNYKSRSVGTRATIDEVGIWTRPLSQTEVDSLYNTGSGEFYPFTTTTAPRIGNITLRVGSNETVLLDTQSIQYVNDTHEFFINYTDPDSLISLVNVSIYNASSKIISYIDKLHINTSSLIFRDFTGNNYTLKVAVTDVDGLTNTSLYNLSFVDTASPVCVWYSPVAYTGVQNATVPINISCTDDSFFNFNITCDNGFNYSVDGLNTARYDFNNETVINSSLACSLYYCDGHTASTLKKEWFIRPSKDRREIEFQAGNSINTLRSMDNATLSYTKGYDRITFKAQYEKIPYSGAQFRYTTSPDAYHFKSKKWPGWIVDSQARTWFDMVQETPGYDVKVVRWNYTTWDIYVTPPEDYKGGPEELQFKSIGELNCVSETQYINFTVSGKSYKHSVVRPPLTTAAALTLFLLYGLWFAFIICTYKLEGPSGQTIQLFNLGQLVVSLVLLIYVFKTFNGLLAIFTGLAGIAIFAGHAFYKT